MRWAALLNAVALLWTALVLVVVANPIKEDSITTIDITERLACDGSHFIVSVQRYEIPFPLFPFIRSLREKMANSRL